MSYQTVNNISFNSLSGVEPGRKDSLRELGGMESASFGELVSFYKDKDAQFENTGLSSKGNNTVSDNSYVNTTVGNSEKINKDDSNSLPIDHDDSSDVEKKEKTQSDKENVSSSDKEERLEDEGKLKHFDKKSESVPNEDNKSCKKEYSENDCIDEKIKDKKDKKLKNKDFSRIDELTTNNVKNTDFIESNKNNRNLENAGILSNTTDKKSRIANKKLNQANNNEVLEAEKKKMSEDGNPELLLESDKSLLSNVASKNKNEDSHNVKRGDGDKADDNDSPIINNSDKLVFMDKDKKITVEDLRTEKQKTVNVVENVKTGPDAGLLENSENIKDSKVKVSEPKLVGDNTANMTIDLKQNANANVLSSNSQTAAANGSNFQAMLSNQIQQNAPEFVKAGNLVLKDNNQGTINLILRPDELGNVKLHLSLDGKNINGHITVATKEALEVFKDNAETLREAFIKNGFESASFDVAYSGNSSSGDEAQFQQQNDGSKFVAKKVYESNSENSDNSLDKIVEKNDRNKEYSINIVA